MFTLEIKKSTAEEALANRHLWLVDITCTSIDAEVSDKIFVYHTDTLQDGVVDSSFECVASIQQLVEIPELEAVEGVPYFRTNNATYFCRSAQEAQELISGITDDAKDLKEHILASKELETVKVINI